MNKLTIILIGLWLSLCTAIVIYDKKPSNKKELTYKAYEVGWQRGLNAGLHYCLDYNYNLDSVHKSDSIMCMQILK